jgi:hypothetical protein
VSRTEGEQPYLTASEVGQFTYCPEAWYLQRFGFSPDGDAMQRLRDGTRQHERIGRTTERIVDTDALRRRLLIIIVALAALVLAARARACCSADVARADSSSHAGNS